MTDYTPMSKDQADAFAEGIIATIESQPAELRDRLYVAIGSELYDVVSASPDELLLDVRGIGELRVRRVNLPPSERLN